VDLDKALKKAAQRIPRREAEMLAAAALRKSRAWVIAHGDHHLSDTEAEAIALTVEARALGSPVAYLLGEREFYGRPFKVDQRVLIPRPETEILVEAALERISGAEPNVLDLGTGSGAIALTLALERPACHVTAIDVSEAALDCAAENAASLEVENVSFMQGAWYAPVAGWTRCAPSSPGPPRTSPLVAGCWWSMATTRRPPARRCSPQPDSPISSPSPTLRVFRVWRADADYNLCNPSLSSQSGVGNEHSGPSASRSPPTPLCCT
jgi:hypothetical protein